MILNITDYSGNSLENAITGRLRIISNQLLSKGKTITDALRTTTRNHFSNIYPKSKHYSPDKVTNGNSVDGQLSLGEVNIEVAGITRAFHDLDIKPKFRKYLTIPIHTKSYGKKATDFQDLIFIRKKDGRAFLAEKTSIGLDFLYRLSTGVHQRQDRRLLPSDQTYVDNICSRITAKLLTI